MSADKQNSRFIHNITEAFFALNQYECYLTLLHRNDEHLNTSSKNLLSAVPMHQKNQDTHLRG